MIFGKTLLQNGGFQKNRYGSVQNGCRQFYGMIPDLSLKYKLADKLIQKSEYDHFIKSKLVFQRR
jgi:protease-4